MAATPARTFSMPSVEPLLRSASPAATRNGRPRGRSIIPWAAAASNTLLPSNFDSLQHQILQQRRESGREMMATIDNLKRLCIDHYFEEEIQSAMGACMHLIHSDDLFDATLAFRLMREAGHDVSADDVLRRFTDGNGEFTLALSKDIRGLLSLHDMSHLNMGEEPSLHKAKEFSSKHLASAIRYLEPGLARYVRQSLDHPYHLSLMQYKARHHLSYLQSLPTRDAAMEGLAIAEFQLSKQLHQEEIQEVKRWWMDLGLSHEISVVRDQVPKWYMWAMTCLQGSSLSGYRIDTTKIISLVYVVDDIFDLHRVRLEAGASSPTVFLSHIPPALVYSHQPGNNVFLSQHSSSSLQLQAAEHGACWHTGGAFLLHRGNQNWAVLFNGFMVEARWLATDQAPTAEDYLRNGVVTSGVPLTFAHIFAMLGYDQSKEELAHDHIPSVISCPAKILRLWDDLGSAKDEAQEGLDGSYRDFYLMENPSCTPEDAEAHMRRLIAREWEELNRECFSGRTFASRFTQACLNVARMVSVMYSYDKEQRLLVLEDYARMLLL